jgi:hypothetical protein
MCIPHIKKAKDLCRLNQGRIQDFVLGGTKVGEGSGDRLRSPAGPGQSRGKGPGGTSPPGSSWVLSI